MAAAFGLWISSPWAETAWGVLVAGAVVYLAFEAIVKQATPLGLNLVSIGCGFIFGTGYWFAAADGGLFAFGQGVPFYGSVPATLNAINDGVD